MITKKQLREELYKLNIPVYAGCKIKKSDVEKFLFECNATPKISLDFIKKVIEAVKDKIKAKGEPDIVKLNTYIKKNTSGDLMQFAKDAIEYFKQGKLKWDNELGLLQDEYQPGGFEIIPWTFMKKQLEDIPPHIEKTLPRAFVQKMAT